MAKTPAASDGRSIEEDRWRALARSGTSNSGSIGPSLVTCSTGSLSDGCELLRLMSMFFIPPCRSVDSTEDGTYFPLCSDRIIFMKEKAWVSLERYVKTNDGWSYQSPSPVLLF